jgi:hypothetical protein
MFWKQSRGVLAPMRAQPAIFIGRPAYKLAAGAATGPRTARLRWTARLCEIDILGP